MTTQTHPTAGHLTLNLVYALLIASLIFPPGFAFALDADALPSGGRVTAGSGSISAGGNAMTINQGTKNMVVNWQSYNIGADSKVTYNQPDSSAIALNRVNGSGASEIYGKLNANGQVFLLNSNGILFGEGARVNVGGLVASTLDMSDEDFMNGNYRFTGTAGSVVNQGNITGDSVCLLGGRVSNQGTITAQLGSVALASGTDITLDFAGDGLTKVTVDKGALDALAENKSLIRADGGQVIMTAKAADSLVKSVVNNDGVIEACTVENRNGTIVLLSDMDNGITNVAGTLDASAPDGGDGGFIETSAEIVTVSDSATITTLAPDGETGTWLIDPTNFAIESGSGAKTYNSIGADTLSDQLEANNVEIETSGSYTSGNEGDINVNAEVDWSAATTLTLTAHNDININADITADNGTLILEYGQYYSGGKYTFNNAAKVNLSDGLHFYTQHGTNAANLIEWTVITTLENLQGIGDDLTGNYVLGADIGAGETQNWGSGNCRGFSPLGSQGSGFSGNFDGLGHTITDLYIYRYSSQSFASNCGLFGFTRGGDSKSVNISNVGLINVNISGHGFVGGLVGDAYEYTNISNCYTTGSVNSYHSGAYTGGLTGRSNGNSSDRNTIDNCYSTAQIFSCNGIAGGLTGYVCSADITNSYATGSVTSNTTANNSVGGLIGSIIASSVRNCYATGTVTSSTQYLGAFAGYTTNSSISNSFYLNVQGVNGNGGQGLTESQMKSCDSFSNQSWDISDTAGSGSVWRIYDGYTYPLLASFLTPATVTADNIVRTYDGTTNGSGTYTAPTGVDTSLISGSLEGCTDKKVGTYTDADVTYTGLYSTQQGYDISYVKGTVQITPAKLTVSAADNKVYDGTTTATISGDNLSGLVSGDSVTLEGSFDDENAGTGKTVTYVNTLTGTDAGNYELNITGTSTIADITPAELIVGGTTTASDKVYNGTTTATVSGGTITGLIAGDTVTLDQTGNFSDKKAGINKTVTYTNSLTGPDAGNYKADVASDTTTADITQAQLTIGGTTTAENKVYDGTTTATVSGGTITGIIGEDAVTLSQTGGFDTKNVGTDKTVTYTNSLSGSDAGNYALNVAGGGTATASITPASLAVTGTSADDKVYDGTTDAVLSGGTLTGLIAGDTVTSSQTGTFADKNAGTDKTVTYTTSISGSDAGNYELNTATGTTTADITAKELTVTGALADNKTYDGNTTATITGGSLNGVVSGEDVTLLSTGSFDDKNIGTGKTVTFAMGGADAGNYQISSTATADIFSAILQVIGADNKIYDGTTDATISSSNLSGLTSGDDVFLSGIFADENVGSNITVTYANILSGADAGNYSLDVSSGSTTADITPKTLTVTGTTAANKVYDGTTDALLSGGILSGLISGESVTLLQSGTFADKNVGNGKAVTYTNSISGTGAGNYILNSTGTTLADINPRTLTVAGGTASDKTYDGTTEATVSGGTCSGMLAGDSVTLLQTGAFSDKNAGKNKTVTYTNYLTGFDSGNYIPSQTGGTATADITAAVVTVTDTTALDKVYDGTTAASLSSRLITGLITGDSVTLSQSGTFADKNVGNNIAVTYTNSLSGADAGNYVLNKTGGTAAADITPAVLTVTGTTAADKVYDGTTDAFLSGSTLSGLVAGDSVFLSQTGAFADKNADRDKTVTYTSNISGTSAGNYILNQSLGTTLADITAKPLTVTGGTAADKIYDSTAGATISGGTFSGLIPGDAVTLTQTGTFADKNTGSGKTVTFTNSLAGTDAANYVADQPTGTTTADITPATLIITANNDGRTAGTQPYYGGNGVVYDGFVPKESTEVLSGTLTFSGSSQGATAAGRYAICPNGLFASNYTVNYVDGTLTIRPNEPYTAAVMTADQTSGALPVRAAQGTRDKADPDQIAARVSTADNPAGSIKGAYSLTIIDGGLRLPQDLVDVDK